MEGQGLHPGAYNPIVDTMDVEDLSTFLEGIRETILKCIDVMPTHEQFIAKNCQAPKTAQELRCV
jgi:tryptophan halogenase